MVSTRTFPAPARDVLATHATAQPSTHTYDPRVRQAITLSPPETWPLLALYARCSPMHSQVDREAMPSTASCARTWRTSWQAVRKVGEVDYINEAFSKATGLADRAARDGRVHAMRQSRGSSDWSRRSLLTDDYHFELPAHAQIPLRLEHQHLARAAEHRWTPRRTGAHCMRCRCGE